MQPGARSAYQVLDHRFAVVSESTQVQAQVSAALHRFAADEARTPTVYRVTESDDAPRFRLLVGERFVFGDSDSGYVADRLLWEVANTALTTATSVVAVHAASLRRGDCGVILPAVSGGGKTTLTAGLVQAGWDFLSDEAALFRAPGRVLPYPRPLNLKEGSSLLADPGVRRAVRAVGPAFHLDADDLRPGCVVDGPAPLRLVLLPEYRPGVSPLLEPVSAADALVALVNQVLNRASLADGGFDLLAETVRRAATVRVQFPTLADGVRLVGEATAAASPVA